MQAQGFASAQCVSESSVGTYTHARAHAHTPAQVCEGKQTGEDTRVRADREREDASVGIGLISLFRSKALPKRQSRLNEVVQ